MTRKRGKPELNIFRFRIPTFSDHDPNETIRTGAAIGVYGF
jgi:hypothetical protein